MWTGLYAFNLFVCVCVCVCLCVWPQNIYLHIYPSKHLACCSFNHFIEFYETAIPHVSIHVIVSLGALSKHAVKETEFSGVRTHVHLSLYSCKDAIENTGKANPNIMEVHWHYITELSLCSTVHWQCSVAHRVCVLWNFIFSMSVCLSVCLSVTVHRCCMRRMRRNDSKLWINRNSECAVMVMGGGGGGGGSGDYGNSVSNVYIVTMGSGFSVKVLYQKVHHLLLLW